MRRQVQTVPRELPHARLYVDDIETVTKIFSEEMLKAEMDRVWRRDASAAPEIKVAYQIGHVEMDSIDDLIAQGGSAAELDVKVFETTERWSECSVRFNWLSSPRLDMSGIGEANKQWEIYARIRAVFEKRRMVVKNLIEDVPTSVKIGVWAFAVVVAPALALLFRGRYYDVFEGIWWVFTAAFLVVIVTMFRPSRVYFVRSHERSRASAEVRRGYWRSGLTFLLGAGVTKLLDWIVTYLHK
jgi:hypothetical protein